ncbi:hypothetical protein CORC01_13277 [Colletotrichum orchidophilum]|uniref:Uncharacterized protein n=1 Tax=Colletotrichum orchidophilum TaxID=1209926 RepID=A0A1G4AQW4_9PEZI|nr:uncharacterized protein CORC01_13277 [Colletotrichum orchidophilum]OHE91412.1 hypothetical protein CORC01_13277 [Colletotrichum orchidophilum]
MPAGYVGDLRSGGLCPRRVDPHAGEKDVLGLPWRGGAGWPRAGVAEAGPAPRPEPGPCVWVDGASREGSWERALLAPRWPLVTDSARVGACAQGLAGVAAAGDLLHLPHFWWPVHPIIGCQDASGRTDRKPRAVARSKGCRAWTHQYGCIGLRATFDKVSAQARGISRLMVGPTNNSEACFDYGGDGSDGMGTG